ncbi:hypothetical protein E2562_029818 [Oryza meyeriana var. granulata]|uniref:DEX1 C-terminal domain-containing protein n=1 Tax=Oryza meyeriana var. granulata TaxID=110450 RepID=A0A6G1CJP8_9ORYZ|nr:hypothetical protein E2562_029818 [Oryza meyeriana var. granulata]
MEIPLNHNTMVNPSSNGVHRVAKIGPCLVHLPVDSNPFVVHALQPDQQCVGEAVEHHQPATQPPERDVADPVEEEPEEYQEVTLLVPGNSQGDRRIVVSEIYHQPGKLRMKLHTVRVRTTGTVLVEMVDKNGFDFSDEFSLTFHMHYYKLLKWLVLLPMLRMFGVLVILRPQEAAPLPSFSRNID